MSAEKLTVAVVGAGNKMGMRVSRNLQKSYHTVFCSGNSPAGQERVRAEGAVPQVSGRADTLSARAHRRTWLPSTRTPGGDRAAAEATGTGTRLNKALYETLHTAGRPREAAKARLFGHVQIALTNALRGSNPFSEACEIAIQYGKDTIIKDDWKKIFDDSELDSVIAKMLKLDAVKR